MIDALNEWLYDFFMKWLFLILIAFFVIGTPVACSAYMHERQAFMEACQADRKEYECTALWRAGNDSATGIIVVPR
ncbi:MAG: hypothetical protein AAF578_00205 [Pseudomonadota bacterium]